MSEIKTSTGWVKASKSGANGGCIEMRREGDLIAVRDSKDPDGPALRRITKHELDCWIDGARRGEFDHLLD